jgi:diguanylate cyclase (GGDEF)-like protein/PAS domain S-box-containing protein
MHKLLERQVRRSMGGTAPAELAPLIALVDEAYRQHDVDRSLLEHALETVSDELTQRYRELREKEERFLHSLVQHSSDVITIVDVDSTIRFHSPSAERVLGYTTAELTGIPLVSLLHPDDGASALALLEEVARSREFAVPVEWRLRHRQGHWLSVETVASHLEERAALRGVVLNTRDISERKALEAKLAHQAFHDPLTGLANRALFRDRLEHALQRAQRHRKPLAVMFLDLDDFKTINDTLGHAEGDRLLLAVASRLLECVRLADTVARLGGDEFAILLEEETDPDNVITVARRLADAMQSAFIVESREIIIGASIGIARGTAESTVDDLLRDADVAMYMAKSRGKRTFQIFEPAMHAALVERLELAEDLRAALKRDELRLEYQPIIDLRSGVVDAVEALVRWDHPGRGLLSPAQFIPLAEETGLIVPLGDWVLRTACHEARAWQRPAAGPQNIVVSVNLSGRQLQEPDLAARVAAILDESGLDPARLVLEITENLAMQEPEVAQARLSELKALGVRLAIDDFGTGYSSLSSLRSFPIDILKIDKSFIETLGAMGGHAAFTEVILMLGESLQLHTVAEGIETEDQLARLRALGCGFGQGFHLGRPVSAADVTVLLERGVDLRTAGELLDGVQAGATEGASR